MTFQESAKKFKPGPVAPPEREEERPHMSGVVRVPKKSGLDVERDGMHAEPMSDGAPGQLKKMPGE